MMRPILLLLPVLVLPVLVLVEAQSAPEVEITAEPHHQLVLTNHQVRVFKVDVAPHDEILMHWHRRDYVYVILSDSEVVNTMAGKDPVDLKLHSGDTAFLSAHFAHAARNLSDHPFRSVIIELLQDESLRHSPAKWDEDRAFNVLPGGTQHILFVKDAVRVSEFELQPNAAIPSHSRSHPLLLVAVTDLDLFTRDPRTHGPPEPAPSPSHFNSGNSIWLPDGFRHPIINAGPHQARFVTLEFP